MATYSKAGNAFVLDQVEAPRGAGLRPGQSLADARAIRPDLCACAAEPSADLALLDAIAAWAERFSPVVVLDPPQGLFVDISGCGHLFGGEGQLLRAAVEGLKRQGVRVRAAAAATPGAAWALARFRGPSLIDAGGLAEALAPLPTAGLRLEPQAQALLARLGLVTIGQLYAVPRAALAARAGVGAVTRLDQALGRTREALSPRRPPPALFAARRFLEPVWAHEGVARAIDDLCADLAHALNQRGAGTLRARLRLFGLGARERAIEIGTSRPEANAKALARLFAERLNAASGAAPIGLEDDGFDDPDLGFEAMRLDALEIEPLREKPRRLSGLGDAGAGAGGGEGAGEEISALIDVLSARMGRGRVLRPCVRAARLPEAQGFRPAITPRSKNPYSENSKSGCLSAPDGVLRRPLSLFPRPQPIEVMAALPDGPPLRFRWRRVLREVARAEGPERLLAPWLASPAARPRDYYRIEDQAGRRYWVFRSGLYEEGPPGWFVHGLFP